MFSDVPLKTCHFGEWNLAGWVATCFCGHPQRCHCQQGWGTNKDRATGL